LNFPNFVELAWALTAAGALMSLPAKAQSPVPSGEIDPGLLVATPADHPKQLRTAWSHGDLDLSFEYRLAEKQHASVYLEGCYRVPLAGFDSGDGPLSDAAKSAGLWQHLHVIFHAPTFAAGQKTKDARLQIVELNQFPVQVETDLARPSSDAPLAEERAAAPLVFVSDGPLQLRHIRARALATGRRVSLEITKAQLFKSPSELKRWSATSAPAGSDRDLFSANHLSVKTPLAKAPKAMAALLTATLTVPIDGTYRFAAQTNGLAQIYIDGSRALAPIALAAGPHSLQITFLRQDDDNPSLTVGVENAALEPQSFALSGGKPKTDPERHAGAPMLKLARDKIVVQRAFVPFGDGKRLETISVGAPQGVNYTYDLDRGTLLRAWRGRFLDMYNMWHERGEAQIASPLNAALTFDGEPAWGELLEPLAYDLEPSGQPVFTARYRGRTITDRIAPNATGTGLMRTLSVSAGPQPVTISLARGGSMTERGAGHYTVADGSYFLDWQRQNELRPQITGTGAGSALVVTLPASSIPQKISYEIRW
jgi:hypothetical protein